MAEGVALQEDLTLVGHDVVVETFRHAEHYRM
jgi:hypothetical protein